MSEIKHNVPNKKSAFNIVAAPVGIGLSIIIYIILTMMIGVIIEWVGMFFLWDHGHAKRVLLNEFQYLGNNFSTTILGVSAKDAALYLIAFVQDNVFSYISINQDSTQTTKFFYGAINSFKDYINAAMFVILIVTVRCLIVLLSSSLFLIVGVAAMVDGLHQRELRKECGGVEHASIYHHAKPWISRIITVTPVLYLAWPDQINPNYILLPGAAIFYVAVMISFSTYKKYL